MGNGFLPAEIDHLIMVAGGIGQTPFMACVREYLVSLQRYGERASCPAPKKSHALATVAKCRIPRGRSRVCALGVDVHVSTDDGSAGSRGFVTEVLQEVFNEPQTNASLDRCRVVCCGPEKMMEAVAHITDKAGVPCRVSLETPMACGIGICFSCVTKVVRPTAAGTIAALVSRGPYSRRSRLCGSVPAKPARPPK